MKSIIYKIFLRLYAVFYMMAGFNHFLSTEVYYEIMPKWLPAPMFLIYLSGITEIILGILLLFTKTRKSAALFITLMLVAFLPVHIYMIELAPFMLEKNTCNTVNCMGSIAFSICIYLLDMVLL